MAEQKEVVKKGIKNILYVISFFDKRDGASTAINYQSTIDKDFYDDYLIVCKWKGETLPNLKIVCIDGNESVIKDFLSQGRVIIHYYKATNSNVFQRICKMAGKDVPKLMTVCQNPSYTQYLLSPIEIREAWKIVFIDKTSYNNPIHSFISEEKKLQIYLSGKWNVEATKNVQWPNNTPYVVYGRGSTLSKCPKQMFEVFDKIDIPKKKFVIVGIPEGDNWVRKEARKRDNVIVYDKLSREEWFNICTTFDIFLYHLPEYSHSSIDGTLGLAMLMRHPVVYMGCEAPKERMHHGINGFVANNIEELSSYATILGKDKILRRKMGQAARDTTISDFSPEVRKQKYVMAYNSLQENIKVQIPFTYYLKFLRRCYKSIIRSIFNIYSSTIDF